MQKTIDPNVDENRRLLAEFRIKEIGQAYTWEGRIACRVQVEYAPQPIHATLAEINIAILARKNAWKKRIDNTLSDAPKSVRANLRIAERIHIEDLASLEKAKDIITQAQERVKTSPLGHGELPPRPITGNVVGFLQPASS